MTLDKWRTCRLKSSHPACFDGIRRRSCQHSAGSHGSRARGSALPHSLQFELCLAKVQQAPGGTSTVRLGGTDENVDPTNKMQVDDKDRSCRVELCQDHWNLLPHLPFRLPIGRSCLAASGEGCRTVATRKIALCLASSQSPSEQLPCACADSACVDECDRLLGGGPAL